MTTPTIPKRFSGCRGGYDAPHRGPKIMAASGTTSGLRNLDQLLTVQAVYAMLYKDASKVWFTPEKSGKKGDKGDLTWC